MNTLIVPCAGRSSRFPGTRPKWLLTHPDGDLMVEKAISGLNLDIFDRIIITTIEPHNRKYESELILKQVFSKYNNVEVCVLDDYTSSVVQTVSQTIERMNISGSIVIRDCDNHVRCILPNNIQNGVAGGELSQIKHLSTPHGKAYLLINEQNIITNIIEKKIVSSYICLGIYAFHDVNDFMVGFRGISEFERPNELYISHVISWLIINANKIFHYLPTAEYEDWGTIIEWNEIRRRYKTLFIDFDGVIMKNSGKYGLVNWSNNTEILPENISVLKKLHDEGAQIVITTSRPEEMKEFIDSTLKAYGIEAHAIITGLNHAQRVLINDFAASNPFPSAVALSVPRNDMLGPYLNIY